MEELRSGVMEIREQHFSIHQCKVLRFLSMDFRLRLRNLCLKTPVKRTIDIAKEELQRRYGIVSCQGWYQIIVVPKNNFHGQSNAPSSKQCITAMAFLSRSNYYWESKFPTCLFFPHYAFHMAIIFKYIITQNMDKNQVITVWYKIYSLMLKMIFLNSNFHHLG